MRTKLAALSSSVLLSACVAQAASWLYDRYGQLADFDFPAKVRADAEFKADAVADAAYYASFTPPGRTFWGSVPGSRKKFGLRATGFFHLERIEALGGRTMLVDPDGNLYFHLGMCCLCPGNEFTPVQGREGEFEWVPSAANGFGEARWGVSASYYIANWIRKFGSYDQAGWQRKMVERCRLWGFNGFGAFSRIYDSNHDLGFATTVCLERYAQTPGLHVIGGRFIDPFDARNREALERVLRARMAPYLGKAELIGWYSENEVRYNQMMSALWAADDDVPAKRRFLAFLSERGCEGEASAEDLRAFEFVFFDAYFKMISETLRRIDPDHLYLGERMIPEMGLYEPAAKALGKYCDVYSVNYYTDGFDRARVKRYVEMSGRPVMLSEWSFGTCEQGLYGCRDCRDQEESGREYRRYVENAAALDGVVGVQWFCLLDEPASGRGWSLREAEFGERMQMGFLNVCDRPFKTFVAAAAAANCRVYDIILGQVKPFDADEPPRTVMHAGTRICDVHRVTSSAIDADPAKYDAKTAEILFMSVKEKGRLADKSRWGRFRFGWDETYFRACVTMPDATPATNDHAGPINRGDTVEICLAGEHVETPGRMLPSDRELIVRVNRRPDPEFEWRNNGRRVTCAETPRTALVLAPDGKGWTMEVAVPWAAVGIKPEAGKQIRFEVTVGISGDSPDETADRIVWNGLKNNCRRRDIWGKGILK